jgi:Plasmid pRiA4b ORF-3-like protein
VPEALVFDAELVDHRGVRRTIAVGENQTLEDLHVALREAFEWWDDHLYSFWLDGEFWGAREREYTSPVEAEPGMRTADATLASLDLQLGQEIAYLFDFGAQWRVRLKLRDRRPVGEEPLPAVAEHAGTAPPQYVYDEDAPG